MAEQRYYWLRLREDFFSSKRIKKLRKLAGGDTLTIIYLKMQLKSIKTDGVLSYTGLEQSFAEELALDLDESADNVTLLLNYLMATGLIETSDDINFLLPYAVENTGSEGSSAKRMRELRARNEIPKLPSSQCDGGVTEVCEHRYGEIEKEIEIEIEKEIKTNKRKRFTPPSVDEVRAYCEERGNDIDADDFIDYYGSQKWKKANGRPVEDWKACIRTWERREKQRHAEAVKKKEEEDKWFDSD